jgi:hypothetical protein
MKPVRRLSLSRTTLRTLSHAELSRVAGGSVIAAPTVQSCKCDDDLPLAAPAEPQPYPVAPSRTPGEVCKP